MKSIPKISSIREMMTLAVKDRPDAIAYEFDEGGKIRRVSVREFYESLEKLGAALTERGFGNAHIACLGENSYPWIQTFVTILMSGGVFVPVDKELPTDNILFLLHDSDSEVVFCSPTYEERLREHRAELPNVKCFVSFGREEHDGDFLSMKKLMEEGARLDKRAYDALKTDENELKYLVYTSGTTGVAKGVMLTEHNIVSGIYYGLKCSQIHGRGLSVLPYNHTYEAVCDILVSLHAGVTLCINDAIKNVQKNLKRFQPNHIYLVPAFSDHFYKVIQNSIRKQGKEKQFAKAVKLSQALHKVGIDLRHVLFKSILSEFGGKLERIVCGGAPIRPEVGAFFDSIGMPLTGGYGITECSPLVSVNDPKSNNFSSAGRKLECLEWRIDEPDSNGIGEICVKGDVVMKGYYRRPDLTAQAIKDGWFYTGDYGFINDKEEIVITGRKKNIIILSNGKNIYPEELEEKIANIPYINEVVVRASKNDFGEDLFLSSEVYIEEEGHNEKGVLADIRKKLSELPSYKQIKNVILRSAPFAKTTTNKIKR